MATQLEVWASHGNVGCTTVATGFNILLQPVRHLVLTFATPGQTICDELFVYLAQGVQSICCAQLISLYVTRKEFEW